MEYTEEKTQISAPSDPEVEERILINPFPQQCPTHILSRPLKVIAGDFSTFDSATIITNWASRYKNVLDTFSYWKADFRLKCALRSSATTYGWGLVGYVYGPMPNIPDAQTKLKFLSTAECAFLDVTSADAVTFEVPFIYPAAYFEQGLTDYNSYFTFFSICDPTTQLANLSTTSPSIQLDVWVEAYNIDVGGYRQPTIAPAVQAHSVHIPEGIIEPHGDRQMVPAMNQGGLLPLITRNIGPLGTVAATTAAVMWNGFGSLHTVDKNLDLVKKYTVGRDKAKPQKKKEKAEKDKQETSAMQITPYGNMNSLSHQDSTLTLSTCGIGGMYCQPSVTKLSDLCMIPEIVVGDIFTFSNTSGLNNSINIILDNFGPFGRVLSDTFRFNRGTHRLGLNFFTHSMIGARFTVQIFYSATSNDLINTSIPTEYLLIKGSQTKLYDIPFHLDTVVAVGDRGTSPERVVAVAKVTCTHLPQPFATGVDAKVFMIPTLSGTEDCQFFSLRARQGFPIVPEPAASDVIEAHSLRAMHQQAGELFGAKGKEIPFLPEITTLEELCQRWSLRDLSGVEPAAANFQRLSPIPYGLQFYNGLANDTRSISYGCEYDIWSECFVATRSSMDFKVLLQNIPATDTRFGKIAWVSMANEGLTTSVESSIDPRNGVSYAYPQLQPALEYNVPFLSRFRTNAITAAALSSGFTTVPIGINTNLTDFAPLVDSNPAPLQQIIWARAGPDLQFHKVNYVPLNYQKAQTQ